MNIVLDTPDGMPTFVDQNRIELVGAPLPRLSKQTTGFDTQSRVNLMYRHNLVRLYSR
jgi:hypothetical protein